MKQQGTRGGRRRQGSYNLTNHANTVIVKKKKQKKTAKFSPVNLTFCLFVKIQSRLLIGDYTRISYFFQYFSRSETRLDLARISLGGHRVQSQSENNFEP